MGNLISNLFPARKDGTAQGVAKYRQMELTHPTKSKLLFIDPYAYTFVIGSPLINWFGYKYCKTQSDDLMSGMWESLICRQLFFDRQMTKAVMEDKVTQIVILGAGYDCRFYRLDCIRDCNEDLTLIEVDQPEVQKLKKEGLKNLGLVDTNNSDGNDGTKLNNDDIETYAFINPVINDDIIEQSKNGTIDFKTNTDEKKYSVQYCPCNFETMNFKDQLLKTKYDPKKKTLFVMEGLTQYVDKDALAETIQTIHQVCGSTGSKILISYVDSRCYDDEKIGEICGDEEQMKKILDLLKGKKEPWITGFDVDESKGTFEMKEWLMKHTDGSFCKDYVDQSWDEFYEEDLVPKERHLYEYGNKEGEPISKWAVERHACITRRWATSLF